jgi:hypothetical protein
LAAVTLLYPMFRKGAVRGRQFGGVALLYGIFAASIAAF